MADFSMMNAIASEIGEKRLFEMAKAYIMYVEDKRSGIAPPGFIWGGEFTPLPESPGYTDTYVPMLCTPRSTTAISPRRLDCKISYSIYGQCLFLFLYIPL